MIALISVTGYVPKAHTYKYIFSTTHSILSAYSKHPAHHHSLP